MDGAFGRAGAQLGVATEEVEAIWRELAALIRQAERMHVRVDGIYDGVTRPEDLTLALGLLTSRLNGAQDAAGSAYRALIAARIQLTQGGQE